MKDVTTTNVLTQDAPLTAKTQRARILQLPHSPDAEQRLLDFVEDLILDLAHTHPRVRDLDVALWIAHVAVGDKK